MALVQPQTVIVFCVLLGVSSGLTPDVELVKSPGETALFALSSASFTAVSWATSNTTIISVSPEGNITNPEYQDRITLFSNGTLELRNVTVQDNGEYWANVTSTGGSENITLFLLSVYEPVSEVNITVNASTSNLIEFRTSVSLTCSASGSSLQYNWYNQSHSLSTNTSVLFISSLKRYDNGPFKCEAFNPISSAVSRDIYLNASYGPDNVSVEPVPSAESYLEGEKITLYCRHSSRPTPRFRWFLDGTEQFLALGSQLPLTLTPGHSGNYSCMAFNALTMIYAWSPPVTISVKAAPVEPTTNSGLSAGAIAGITIGSLAAVAATVGLFVCIKKKLLPRKSIPQVQSELNSTFVLPRDLQRDLQTWRQLLRW
ncbi:hypothetical protein WMY93_015247 [Mugilogobius chulae]|uniref:Ig-like domain-containing protein n=1 Tax=Mugilogobius chulae TaxID=88201 RepID=A0AAW0NQ09_9GOBI